MKRRIAREPRLRYRPVALVWAEDRPAEAAEFMAGKWGCVMWTVACAARGGTAVCGRQTFGCWGGGVGEAGERQTRGLIQTAAAASQPWGLFSPSATARSNA